MRVGLTERYKIEHQKNLPSIMRTMTALPTSQGTHLASGLEKGGPSIMRITTFTMEQSLGVGPRGPPRQKGLLKLKNKKRGLSPNTR
jgi:hypothetical protein